MKYSNQSDDFYERPAIGRFFFFPKGALTHHLRSRRWYPFRWSGSCALHELSIGHFSREGRKCRKSAFPVQSALLLMQRLLLVAPIRQILCPPPACENLPPAALSQIWAAMQPIFSLQRETETKGWRFTTPSQNTNRGERKWQFTTWRQRWSAGEPDAPPVQPPLISAAPTSSMTMTGCSTTTPESKGWSGSRYFCRTRPRPHGKTGKCSGTPWRKTRKPRTAAWPVSSW